MVRQRRRRVRVLYNRCAHKGTPLVSERSGNTGRFFRCPYHAWTYRLDGALLRACRWRPATKARGLRRARRRAACRRRPASPSTATSCSRGSTPAGPASPTYFGEALAAIDNLVDRSPVGRLRDRGRRACARLIRCNWKTYLENINDTVHPLSTHESASGAAATALAGPARRRAQADGDRADPAVRRRPRLLRPHGRPRPAERAQRPRHAVQHPLGLRRRCPSTRRRCARRTATSAPPRSCSARRRTRSASRAWR